MNNKIIDGHPKNEDLDLSGPLAKTVINSLSANIAIIDETGVILETNQAWRNYATLNQMEGANDSIGVNYLKLCDATIGKEANDARNVAAGIRSVIRGEIKEFMYDYPCHGPDGLHFYYVRAIRVAEEQPIRVVVSHEDITALKLAEEALRKREKERDRLRHSLELAREVQQILLPKDNPGVPGLDVAVISIYCDETGGDYYDFIDFREIDNDKFGVVVGDVAGHGISSALLLATLRSALRQRIASPGPISQVIADVNNQLVGDFAESGQFATLFYLSIDTFRRTIEWVRAGHDPAIYYDPAEDKFIELDGFGMALGIEMDSRYEANRQNDFSRGSIIVLGTDGIWETRNESGRMFGKTALYDVIRNHSAAGANDIMEAVLKQIDKFSKAGKPEDDVTLVVIKIL